MSITNILANFETSLAGRLSSTGSNLTLVVSVDDDGGTLSGSYILTIDEGTNNEEHLLVALSGSAGTITTRGLSRVDAETNKSENQYEHARGASVKITNMALFEIKRVVNGDAPVPNKLTYENAETISDDKDLANKKYADDLAIAGSPDMTTTVKGLAEEATEAEIDAGTATGGTSARLAINPATLETSIYGTQLPSSGQKSALAGTSGTPSGSNKYVTDDDTTGTGNVLRDSERVKNSSTLTAGETISGATLPVACYQNTDEERDGTITQSETYNYKNLYGDDWACQTFRLNLDAGDYHSVKIDRIRLYLDKTNSPSGNFYVEIFATDGDGKPTGSALATANILASYISTTASWIDFEFDYSFSLNTTYAIVCRCPGGDSSNHIDWSRAETNVYADGKFGISGDGGSSWSLDDNKDGSFYIYYKFKYLEDTKIYACDADDEYKLEFIGFGITDGTDGNDIDIQHQGLVSGFTGLMEGTKYYVQNDKTIGTTQGDYKVLVGIAISETELVILREKRNEFSSGSQLFSSNDAQVNFTAYMNFWKKYKETQVYKGGRVKIMFRLYDGTGGSAYAQIYVNDAIVGTEREVSSGFEIFTESILCSAGDKIQIYGKSNFETGTAPHVCNFRIYVEAYDGYENTLE